MKNTMSIIMAADVFLERYIKEGVSRDKRDTFRLYYFGDDDNKEVVIGYLPDHLKTSIS